MQQAARPGGSGTSNCLVACLAALCCCCGELSLCLLPWHAASFYVPLGGPPVLMVPTCCHITKHAFHFLQRLTPSSERCLQGNESRWTEVKKTA